jgi:hypothetical protein
MEIQFKGKLWSGGRPVSEPKPNKAKKLSGRRLYRAQLEASHRYAGADQRAGDAVHYDPYGGQAMRVDRKAPSDRWAWLLWARASDHGGPRFEVAPCPWPPCWHLGAA